MFRLKGALTAGQPTPLCPLPIFRLSASNPVNLIAFYKAAWASLASGNEPGNASLDNGIEPDPQLDVFVDFPHCLPRKSGEVKVFLDSTGGLCGGQERRPTLNGPCECDLSRSFADPGGDCGNDRIRQHVGLPTVTQSSESLQHDSIPSAIVQKFPFRQIRMGFYVNDCRFYARSFKNLLHPFQANVG